MSASKLKKKLKASNIDPFIPSSDYFLNKFTSIIGVTGSGKTTLLHNITKCLSGKIRKTVVFSSTASTSGDYDDYIPQIFIHDEVNDKVLQKIYLRQVYKSSKLPKEEFQKYHQMLLIFDDVSGQNRSWADTSTFRNFITNARRYGITVFFLVHESKYLPTCVRNNSHYAIMTKVGNMEEYKKFYEAFWSYSKYKKKQAIDLLSKFTALRDSSVIISKTGLEFPLKQGYPDVLKKVRQIRPVLYDKDQLKLIKLFSNDVLLFAKKYYNKDWLNKTIAKKQKEIEDMPDEKVKNGKKKKIKKSESENDEDENEFFKNAKI